MVHQNTILETLFVKNINDKPEDIEALKTAYKTISPLRIDLSTIDRPPAYDVTPIDATRLYEIAEHMGMTNISVAIRKNSVPLGRTYSEDEWLNTLSKRPLTLEDARFLADKKSFEVFENMIKEGRVVKKSVVGVEFYS
jgi:wyosine [tRNA(Phe)-imidazoG37] synthetase (radical SAM superfamily)